MENLAYNRITAKIKQLPDDLVGELDKFVDYLLFKKEHDWAEELNDEVRQSIDKGLEDIEHGRVRDHQSVMDEMSAYIRSQQISSRS